MQIFVRTLKNTTIAFEMEASDTIEALKANIFDREAMPPQYQRLVYGGKELDNLQTLGYYDIKHFSTLHMVGHL